MNRNLVSVQLEGELSKKKERIDELQHALTTLDQEHDALRSEVDAKAELLAQLEQQVTEKERLIQEHLEQVRELEEEMGRRKGDNERKGEDIRKLRQQIDQSQREMEQLNTELTRASQREDELRQDLGTMTQVWHIVVGGGVALAGLTMTSSLSNRACRRTRRYMMNCNGVLQRRSH